MAQSRSRRGTGILVNIKAIKKPTKCENLTIVIWSNPVAARSLQDYADLLDINAGSFDTTINEQYAVMFDAGSSGTRVKVYKYSKKDGQPLQVNDLQEIDVPKPNKFKPGLSSFANNIKGIKEYLKPLIESAKKVVPDNKESSASLRIFATAGMRLLKDNEVKAIFDEVDSLLLNRNINTFSYKKGNAKVITGQDEAVYDWVTVNFLKGALSGGDVKTYGALDMGGASHQNSFELSSVRPKYKASTVALNIAGKVHTIYAHSYLGGGEKEARTFFLKNLVKKSSVLEGTPNVVYSSCHNYGLVRNVTVDGVQFEVRGVFSSVKCSRLLKEMFFCNRQRCKYQSQPKLRGVFYSFSVFSYCFQATGAVSGNDEVVSLGKIDKTIQSFCNKRYDQLDFDADPYPDLRCFQLNYIQALLRFGYRVSGRNFKLRNASKLNGFNLNWAVGALLVNNNLL